MIRVLVIDDSPTMRQLIRMRLRADTRIKVVGEASNADEASRQIAELQPDVVTLDVEMPGKSGLDFLRELMRDRPIPVIMVSSETQRGSAAAVEALSRGAVECVGKPRGFDFSNAFGDLPGLVVAAASARLRPRAAVPELPAAPATRGFDWNGRYVLIGSSTGGVDALEQIISGLPENCPPVLITQHMPEGFLANFAQRLNARFAPDIRLAIDGAPLAQGQVLIAPGGETHLAVTGKARPRCSLVESEKVSGHRPSVDVLFRSAVHLGDRVVGALLTGMGADGAAGMAELRRAGACCLAQDEASSVVWGMPRVAWETGAAERLVALSDISRELLRATARTSHNGAGLE